MAEHDGQVDVAVVVGEFAVGALVAVELVERDEFGRAWFADGFERGPIDGGADLSCRDPDGHSRPEIRSRRSVRLYPSVSFPAHARPHRSGPPRPGDRPPARVDAAIIGHIAQVLRRAERQYETLVPQAAIQTVLDQRHLARHLLDGCPPELRPRLLSVYADLCRVTGVFIFDLGQYQASMPHFEEARTAAHEASNTELGALTLCHMSYSAIWQGRPRLAFDHAVAAVSWAHRTPDHALQANTSDMAARAFAAAGDYDHYGRAAPRRNPPSPIATTARPSSSPTPN